MDPSGLRVLDAGCGRGDLWEFLHTHGHPPAEYIGLEAMPALAAVATGAVPAPIVQCDFIAEPNRLHTGSELIVFCGSLNTCDLTTFWNAIENALSAASIGVVFNFLCGQSRAMADHLTWQTLADARKRAQLLSRNIVVVDDYLAGDATIALFR